MVIIAFHRFHKIWLAWGYKIYVYEIILYCILTCKFYKMVFDLTFPFNCSDECRVRVSRVLSDSI